MGWFVHYWDEIDKRNVCSDATRSNRVQCSKHVA
jgi:hypothetical protein